MEKTFALERDRFRQGRGRLGNRTLHFKRKYKHRNHTQTGREHYGYRRKEHLQLDTVDIRQQGPSTSEGNGEVSSSHWFSRENCKPKKEQDHQSSHSYKNILSRDQSSFKKHTLNMIVMDLQAPSVVNGEGFQRFVKALHPSIDVPPNASWIRAELLNMYQLTKLEVEKEVSNATDLVLSAEMWSSSKELSYLTVTCHFIDKNWEMKSYMLGTAHLLGEHTPENVHQQLQRISKEWKILEKVHVVVVNVDGMKKANPKTRWMYIPCFGHTLNKVFKEVIDNQDWRDMLRKCRHIVAFFQQNSNMEFSQNIQLTQSPSTEWLAVLSMLEKISAHWSSISQVFIDQQVENLWLNEKERMMLKSAENVLGVVKNITREIGRKDYSSISNIIPLLDELQRRLRQLEHDGNKTAQRFAERCDHHIGSIKHNSLFTVSTVLDPRFKTCVLQNGGVEEKIKKEMQRHMSKVPSSYHRDYGGMVVLQRYMSGPQCDKSVNPLGFWATKVEFKELARVAHKYLSVVSTAVPVECITQEETSQLIFNRRKCLELENVNVMLFLNSNQAKIK